MPRANRHFLSGHVWHITHRCHEREFLLKFARDRMFYLHWLFQSKKRFELCILNYAITSNHVHLLVQDGGKGEIARTLQLTAGRTGQWYNRRKRRQGAFWGDRYHATAVATDEHLQRCLVYIDLNMVRAGVVAHPREWDASGYREIQAPPKRYAIIDVAALSALCGFEDVSSLQAAHRRWVEEALSENAQAREACWSEAIAAGSRSFVEKMEAELGIKGKYRDAREEGGTCTLRQPTTSYTLIFGSESGPLRSNNDVP